MSSWKLSSIPPHDWFICLDVESYFDHEHDPERIFEEGFARPLPVGERDVMVTVFFNGDPEQPEFHMESAEPLDREEIETANRSLRRILGTELDLRPLYEQAAGDPVLGDKLNEMYGLKRMARANLFEDTVNRIIQMRLSHKPTAKKMVYRVREHYGTLISGSGDPRPAWPRPHQLVRAEPDAIRRLGPTRRKGEFLAGFAEDIVSGAIDLQELEECAPADFYERISKVRGIGPTSAQQLMLFRNRPDAVFPSRQNKGEERGLRRWIIMSYDADPANTSEEQYREMTARWDGYEAAAMEFLFVHWVLSEKARKRSN